MTPPFGVESRTDHSQRPSIRLSTLLVSHQVGVSCNSQALDFSGLYYRNGHAGRWIKSSSSCVFLLIHRHSAAKRGFGCYWLYVWSLLMLEFPRLRPVQGYPFNCSGVLGDSPPMPPKDTTTTTHDSHAITTDDTLLLRKHHNNRLLQKLRRRISTSLRLQEEANTVVIKDGISSVHHPFISEPPPLSNVGDQGPFSNSDEEQADVRHNDDDYTERTQLASTRWPTKTGGGLPWMLSKALFYPDCGTDPTLYPRGHYWSLWRPCTIRFYHYHDDHHDHHPRPPDNSSSSSSAAATESTITSWLYRLPVPACQPAYELLAPDWPPPLQDYLLAWPDECVGRWPRCYSIQQHQHFLARHACHKGWNLTLVTHVSIDCTADRQAALQEQQEHHHSTRGGIVTDDAMLIIDRAPSPAIKVDWMVAAVLCMAVLLVMCWVLTCWTYRCVIRPFQQTQEQKRQERMRGWGRARTSRRREGHFQIGQEDAETKEEEDVMPPHLI